MHFIFFKDVRVCDEVDWMLQNFRTCMVLVILFFYEIFKIVMFKNLIRLETCRQAKYLINIDWLTFARNYDMCLIK